MNLQLGKSTFELLSAIIATISPVITYTAVTTNADGSFTLTTCNTLWCTGGNAFSPAVGFQVTINSVNYSIIKMVPNISITVVGGIAPPASGTFNLYPPVFYHGTIQATTTDLTIKTNTALLSRDKLPMIWLHEPVVETINTITSKTSAILMDSQCDIYFCADADFAGWSNTDHYTYAIKPMRQLFHAFYDAMNISGLVNETKIETYTFTDLPRFGRYNAKENAQAIFSDYNLSGTKVSISIPFIRNSQTCC